MEPTALPVLDPIYRLGIYQAKTLRGGAPILQRALYRLMRAGVDITDPVPCWPWPGSRNGPGYGKLTDPAGGESYAHRIMYREAVGPIPEGYQIDHRCHSQDPSCQEGPRCPHRRCCNPTHLEAVTATENHRRRRTDVMGLPCANGPHEFEPHRNGTRGCRLCFNAYVWSYKRGFRGTYAEMWQSSYARDYQSVRKVG